MMDQRDETGGPAEPADHAARDMDAASPPAPDLGHLPALIGYLLRRAQLAAFQDFARAHAEFGLRPAQYAALTIIERNPGLKQKDVSEALGIKRANFVAMCDELESLGLAERKQVPTDRRSYALYLTRKGKALLKKLHPAILDHERRLVALIGGEDARWHLVTMLTALAEVGQNETPGAPG